MFIRSERLFLRPGWTEDWEEIPGLIGDRQIISNLADVSVADRPAVVRALAGEPQQGRHPHFLVTLPDGKGARIVGVCGIASLPDGQTELGFWIAPNERGNGYATEAARAVLRLARTLGHSRVTASHFVDSPASAVVLRKLGFEPTGEVRQRFHLAGGDMAPAIRYTCDLGAPFDCDNGFVPMSKDVA